MHERCTSRARSHTPIDRGHTQSFAQNVTPHKGNHTYGGRRAKRAAPPYVWRRAKRAALYVVWHFARNSACTLYLSVCVCARAVHRSCTAGQVTSVIIAICRIQITYVFDETGKPFEQFEMFQNVEMFDCFQLAQQLFPPMPGGCRHQEILKK